MTYTVLSGMLNCSISYHTSLQVEAIGISLDQTDTICNMYIPHTPLLRNNLIHQLPIQFLFIGDFNAHHPIWGNPKQCPKGTLIENIIVNNDISLLNWWFKMVGGLV